MPESVCLDFSANSDDPILEFDDLPKSGICQWKYFALMFLMIFSFFIFGLELYLYPFPPQIDAYEFCENISDLISRTDFKYLKAEFEETENKLASIKFELKSTKLESETLLGYKIAKEMLEEYKTEIVSNIKRQKNLWKEYSL
uniref:ATP synthase F0 subunit 8 n=1 Tax=Panagrolaimus sp. PS1159 TaxID=55785 RepID=A0AC35FHA6_9BILA